MNKLAVAIGNFLFHYRNAIGPAGFLLALFFTTPSYPLGRPDLGALFNVVGIFTVGLGQAIRIVTIGYEYIERGGRDRRVYASRLVQGGIFGQCRNPMYVGNVLICAGVVLVAHTLAFYVIVLPFVLLSYLCIVAAEEAFLRDKFGAEYEEYCSRVNRWWPRLSGWQRSLQGMRFNWKRVLVKEYNTVFILVLALAALMLWNRYSLAGPEALPATRVLATAVAGWLILYAVVRTLKKGGYVKA